MAEYIKIFITKEDYDAKKQFGDLYEGFVIGVGYAYYLVDTKYFQLGCFYDRPVGSRFSTNVPWAYYTQYLDTSFEMVVFSYGAEHHIPDDEFTYTYAVKVGDTLSGIASMFKCSIDSIIQMNKIENPNKIYPSQELKIRLENSALNPPRTVQAVAVVKPVDDGNRLDPTTAGRNWSGSYLGPNNPMSINGQWNYEAPAANANDYPAIRHDRFYDIVEVEGAAGVLFNTNVIGADYRFVYEEFAITFGSGYTFKERAVGAGSGLVILTASIPKASWHKKNVRNPSGLI